MERISQGIAAASLALCAGLALAQSSAGGGSRAPVVSEINAFRTGAALQPETDRGNSLVVRRQGSASSTTTLNITDDEHTYAIVIRDGEVSAKIDGQPVPDDRIERRGRVLVLTHTDGTQSTFDIGGMGTPTSSHMTLFDPSSGSAWATSPGAEVRLRGAVPGAWGAAEEDQPRVIIGITLGDVEDVLAQHLGIDASKSILVLDAPEDLPAAKAGIEANDIIIGLDGSADASPERLRELLSGKDPGDAVKVRVIRRGEKKDFEVRVQENQLSGGRAAARGSASHDVEDEIRRAMEEALAGLRAGQGAATTEAQAAIEEAMEEVRRALSQARHHQDTAMGRYRLMPSPGLLWTPDASGVFVPPPAAPTPPSAPSAAERAELDALRAQIEIERKAMAEERAALQAEMRALREAIRELARERSSGGN